MVALLLDVGDWRLPFLAFGGMTFVLWALLWVWFPQSQKQPGQSLSFFSLYREVGPNARLQMAFLGVFSHLAPTSSRPTV